MKYILAIAASVIAFNASAQLSDTEIRRHCDNWGKIALHVVYNERKGNESAHDFDDMISKYAPESTSIMEAARRMNDNQGIFDIAEERCIDINLAERSYGRNSYKYNQAIKGVKY